jgi:L-asparaginase
VASKIRIAHLAGPNATIQNTPPLVTSNKARVKRQLPVRCGPDGTPLRYDVLRPQRLAAPAKVYVEQFSAHPLESDAAELYGPPDGYLHTDGTFSQERENLDDRPVYEIELRPDDGYYPLPYMAVQADGSAWEEECTQPFAPESHARQPFLPDGSRSFEEIDRLGMDDHGLGNGIGARADVDFYRIEPPSGFTKGLPATKRTDVGEGDIQPEVRGRNFFPNKPIHLEASPPRPNLANIVNAVQHVLSSGAYQGAIWTQGSPRIEEALYWFNLLLDTTVPLCGNSAQRPHGTISNDGPRNIVDSVYWIESRAWADEAGRNCAGVVLVSDQRVFAAREVAKVDARPGGYVAVGGHGGILGSAGGEDAPILLHIPAMKHTYRSEVNITRLPAEVVGVLATPHGPEPVKVAIKSATGELLESAIPRVAIIKDGSYFQEDWEPTEDNEVDLLAMLKDRLARAPLAGFVNEGPSPYGRIQGRARKAILTRAVYSGIPVILSGRGNTEGFSASSGPFIGASNLSSTKARLLLMATLMKLGSLPPAKDPDHPTADERAATDEKLTEYRGIFRCH